MARKTFVELVDDLDGSTAEESVTFGLDGVAYEIDLSEANAQKLRDEMGTWVVKARRVGGRRQRGTGLGTPQSSDKSAIRAWAKDNGYEVSDRGRIPAHIEQAYADAH